MATLDDFESMMSLDVDFIELLIRSGDSSEDLELFVNDSAEALIIHAPEKLDIRGLEVLLDLASPDEEYRRLSTERIQGLIDSVNGEIPIVVHPGGVYEESFPDTDLLINNLTRSLRSLDGKIWLENMPLRYHHDRRLLHCNIMTGWDDFRPLLPFVDGLTLDVSHAYLSTDKSSAEGNRAIRGFIESLGAHIRHVHLSDAAHPVAEGLPLGEGDIEFSFLPRISHLPLLLEIRGGHKEDGGGFREAIDDVRKLRS